MLRKPIFWIIALGFCIRLISLNQSLWLDEGINVLAAKNSGFWSMLTVYPIADFHPPGYFALLWGWIKVFGASEVSVRVPSVFLGLGTIFLTYLIGKRLKGEWVGYISALLLVLAPLHIYYSQEARMYSMAAFSVALSFYFLINLLQNRKNSLAGYAFSVFLVLCSDYVAYFALVAQLLYVIIFERRVIKKYLGSLILGLLTFIPWIPFFIRQLSNGQSTARVIIGWSEVVGGADIKNLLLLGAKTLVGRITMEDKTFYGLILILIGVTFLYPLIQLRRSISKTSFLLFWLIIPPVLAFLISIFIPVFSYFRFIFILPAFYLLVVWGLSETKPKFRWMILALILISELSTSFAYLLNPNFHREDWKGAASYVRENIDSSTLVLFKDQEVFSPYIYYSKDNASEAVLKKIPAEAFSDLNLNLDNKDKILLFDYLTDITDPNRLVDKELVMDGFRQVGVKDIQGVGFIRIFER